MKRIYVFSVAIGLLVGSVMAYISYQKSLEIYIPEKPNILVLSLCSLRKAEFDFYDSHMPVFAPNINQTFAKSFVLDNVYSSFGWTNLSLYFTKQFEGTYLPSNGYEIIEDDWRPSTVHVPSHTDSADYQGPPEQFVNYIEPKLDFVKQRILAHRKRPFFGYIHIKYMHFPYMDNLNDKSRWDRYLSPEEKARVEVLLSEPARAREKLPFAMALSGDLRLLEAVPEFKTAEVDPFKAFFGMYNLLLDQKFLARWMAQSEFRNDLSLLRKVYQAKLSSLDEKLRDMLNLYGRKDLMENTLVVLMGDHGEALMEHNMLGHGNHVYDEILTLPVMVRYPQTRLPGVFHVRDQIYMGSLVDWLKQVVTTGHREKQFVADLTANPRNSYIVSRNCTNNIHSVRLDNRWKFILDRVKREKLLFDLKKDPQEKTNVYDQHPEVAADLEIYLTNHLPDLEKITDPTPCKL